MRAAVVCPTWCTGHQADHEGTLLHAAPVGGVVVVERYDQPAGDATPAEDYVWLAIGEGVALSVVAARAHIAAVQRALDLLGSRTAVAA